MKYRIISDTENGPILLGAESFDHAEWIAKRMRDDFGASKVFEYTATVGEQPVYKLKRSYVKVAP